MLESKSYRGCYGGMPPKEKMTSPHTGETPMPKRIVPLTETQIKNFKPQAKATKLFDGGGLFLFVTPSGGKL
jgi:hypothetical protein